MQWKFEVENQYWGSEGGWVRKTREKEEKKKTKSFSVSENGLRGGGERNGARGEGKRMGIENSSHKQFAKYAGNANRREKVTFPFVKNGQP